MNDSNSVKKPWQSKTNWVGFALILYGLASLFGFRLGDDQATVEAFADSAVAVSGLLTIIFRSTADRKVKL